VKVNAAAVPAPQLLPDRAKRAQRSLRAATTANFSEAVRQLVKFLGSQLTAYIGHVEETRAVREWIAGKRIPHPATEAKLRLTLQIAAYLAEAEGTGPEGENATIPAWFLGMNPALDYESPADVIRNASGVAQPRMIQAVYAAAREFVDT
jgi:hypothetical protein